MSKPTAPTETAASPVLPPAICSGYTPERTRHRQENPSVDDVFTRGQIIAYLEEIPLGYVTERDHKITEKLITRAQRHFSELSTKWEPSDD